MFLIPRRQIWTQQPQGAVDIDWSNPLTRGLTYATADGAGGADSSITSLGSVPKIADRWGKGDYFDGSSQKIAKNSLVGRSLDLTVCVLHKSTVLPPNGPTYCHVLASTTGASAADYYGWILMLGNGTGLPLFRVYQSNIGTQDAECDATTGALNDGKPHLTIATVYGGPGGAMSLDVDGKTVASSTHPSGLYSRTNNLAIGKARHDFWGGFEGSIGAVFVFDRVLSAKERSSLSANPWQIFKRPDSRIFVPVSVGGGPTNITGILLSTLDSITTAIQGSLGHSGTLSISLDTIAVTGNGVLNHIGTSSSTLDGVVITFSGAVDTAGSVSGTLACTLDSIVFSGAGNLNHSTTISITLDDVFVSLAGTVAGTPENIDGTVSIILDGIGFISSGNSGTITLTEDDINAIMTAIINNPKTLTVPKFLGLK